MNNSYSTNFDSFASPVFPSEWETSSYYTDGEGRLQETKMRLDHTALEHIRKYRPSEPFTYHEAQRSKGDLFEKGSMGHEQFLVLTESSPEVVLPHSFFTPALSPNYFKTVSDDVVLRVRKHMRLNLRHTSRHQVLHFWDLGSLFLETLRDHPELTRANLIQAVAQSVVAPGNGIDDDEKKNYASENLEKMIRFALCFRDRNIVERLAIKVRWPHFKEILVLEDPMAREFYAELCWQHNWRHESRLVEEITHKMWERSALSRQPADEIQRILESVRQGIIPEIFNLKDVYYFGHVTSTKKLSEIEDERELEDLIVSNVSRMISEIGVGIDYAGHQVDLKVDTTNGQVVTYHIDILLKFWDGAVYRGFIIELKTVPFKSDHFGQIDGYTDIYNEKLRRHGEGEPIRLILVPAKNDSLLRIMERGTGKPNFYVSLLRVTHDETEWRDLLRESIGHSEDRAEEDRELLARLERNRE